MRLRCSLLIVLLALASVACADDGWWLSSGAAGVFGKSHPAIEMADEVISIDMGPTNAVVDVVFTFRNHGPATKVTMAFPEETENENGKAIQGFKSWVDGQPTRVTRKDLPTDQSSEANTKAVWLKTVSFARNASRKVRVHYIAGYAGNTAGERMLAYTLTTGATWKGAIGKCVIEVDWKRMTGLSRPEISLGDRKLAWTYANGHRASAVLHNYEPKEELAINMLPGFWYFTINGKPVSQMGRGLYAKPMEGMPSDPMIHVENIGYFFGAVTDDEDRYTPWKNPISKRWGGSFDVRLGAIVFGNGKMVNLKRGFKMMKSGFSQEPIEFVYVKDLIEALGGTARFDAQFQRMDIKFP